MGIFVDDSAVTVVWDASDTMTIVTPCGDHKPVFQLRAGVPEDEYERFVEPTTAGDEWAGLSHWYFASICTHRYFCIRTWWGRRLVVDVEARRLVDADCKTNQALHEVERRYLLHVVEAVNGNKTLASKILGLDRKTLYRKLQQYGAAE